MSDFPISVAGVRATAAQIFVAQVGRWIADVDFDAAAALPAGQVPLVVGAATFTGTVDPAFSGTFAGRRRVRIVAGANGWARVVGAKHFHNDAGVTDRTVIAQTAAEVGETAAFISASARVGNDYVRQTGRAGAVLSKLAPSWWIDYAGVTQVGARPFPPALGSFDLLEFDPRHNVAMLATSDVLSVGIGSQISDRLDTPLTVRELIIRAGEDGVRVRAWGTT